MRGIWGLGALGWVCACTAPARQSGGADPDPQPPSDFNFESGDNDASTPPGPPPPRPDYGPTVMLADPPPPVSGGTLATALDGSMAVAADPDRDAVYVVDLKSFAVSTVVLQPHDEPGRVALDGSGRAHVALRRGGDLATIDLQTLAVTRRHACGAPRGVVWESASDRVHVACATGEIVSFPAAGGDAVRSVFVERDLRDVLVVGGSLVVSRFKTAEILWLSPDETKVTTRVVPKVPTGYAPYAAWRTIVSPGGDVVVIHQQSNGIITTQGVAPYYGASDGRVTTFKPDGTFKSTSFAPQPLAVDVAIVPPPSWYPNGPARFLVPLFANAHTQGLDTWSAFQPGNGGGLGPNGPPPPEILNNIHYAFTAVAATGTRMILQSRQPARLLLADFDGTVKKDIELSSVSREDTGHAIFHSTAGAPIACGSCHLEGGDDGRTWEIDKAKRRTPSLRGTVAGTAPYHWEGDLASIDALLGEVYAKRMNGGPLKPDQAQAAEAWLGALPAPPAIAVDANAAARGKLLFEGAGGCTTCHTGGKLTDNQSHFVGNADALQTPSLVGVGWRAPFLHDGCAATLRDRFTTQCRSAAHGNTASLAEADLGDLISYLESR